MKTVKRISALMLAIILSFGSLSVPAFASKTEWGPYGGWSAWQDAYVSENNYRKVETRQVDDQPIYATRYSYKTVYHYYRYATSLTGGSSSYGYHASGTNYYQIDLDYELEYAGNYGSYAAYKWWYSKSHWRGVFNCDPFTTQEIASSWQELTGYTKKTQYRYCTRAKTDSYYISYNANGGTGAPATQTKTVVTDINGTTINNATLSSATPTKTYTITYNANGGTVSPASKSVSCTFKNWNTNSGGTGTAYNKGAAYSPNADVTLYAQWTNPTAGTLATPSRTGHRFDGWFTAANGGSQMTSDATVSSNTTVYAHWTANTYTISYNANGGTGAPGNQTKTYGVNLTLSSVKPTRKGYIFKGWGESATDDARYKAGGAFTKNETKTLYAVWQAEKYTVSFDANGGTGAPEPGTFEYDKYYTISKTAPVKTYTVTYNANGGSVSPAQKTASCLFTGWNSLQNGTGKSYAPGAAYTSDSNAVVYAQWRDQAIGELAYPTRTGYAFEGWFTAAWGGTKVTTDTVVSSDVTVYAHWSAERYEVIFHPAGGQCGFSGIHVVYDGLYGELPVPTRTGYRFDGWFTEQSGGTQIKADTTVKITARQTLFAHWTAERYTLLFDAAGGVCGTASKTVVFDSAFGELPVPKKDGFRFVGWFDAKEDGALVQASDPVHRDIGTLYAYWSALQTYIVNYNANGGAGAPPAGVKTETKAYTISNVIPQKTVALEFDAVGGTCDVASVSLKCDFVSWNTAGDGSGTEYMSAGVYTEDRPVTLFAQYRAAAVEELPTASKSGYAFDGWYLNDARLNTGSAVSSNGRYAAKWIANEYGISFRDGGDELGFSSYTYDKAGKLSYGIQPQKEGYHLAGWATAENGPVVYRYDQEILNLSAENEAVVTLYAVWHKLLTVQALSYSFGNSHSAFGYPADYKIPLSSYRYIFGNNVRAQQLFFNDKSQKNRFWSGNCFGMSTTSSLFNAPGSNITVRDFRQSALLVSDLRVEDKNDAASTPFLTFLEGMQISQKCTLIQRDYTENANHLNELCKAVENANYIDELPVIALFGSEGGHAVVGYSVKKVSDTQSNLYIYDCNFPLEDRYVTLTTDADGNYTGWYYKINDRYDWGTEYDGSWISYIPYDHISHIWNNHGDISKIENQSTNILSVNTANFIIRDRNGDAIGQAVDGKFTSFSPDVFEMAYAELGSGAYSGSEVVLPTDRYTIQNLDGAAEGFTLSLVDTDLGVTVTTDAREITLDVADDRDCNAVRVQTIAGDAFDITLRSSANNGYDEVRLTGVSDGSEIFLAEENSRLQVNAGNSTLVSLTVDGRSVIADGNILESNCACGKYHTGPFGGIVKFFHKIVYFFKNLFK